MSSADHWATYMGNVDPCYFPRMTEGKGSHNQRNVTDVKLPCAGTALQEFCKVHQVSLQTPFQASWALTLRQYVVSDDVVFGTMQSREVGEGFTYAVHKCALDGNVPVVEIMKSIQADLKDNLPNRENSWESCHGSQTSTEQLLFNTAVCFNSGQENFGSISALTSESMLTLHVTMGNFQNITATLECPTSVVSKSHAVNIASTFGRALSCVLGDTSTPVNCLDLFGEEHLAQVLEWNKNWPESLDACVHDLIQQQAIAQPDAPAVCSWDANFTFKELDDLSSRLSLHLIKLGVGAEVMVPFCFHKSAWTIVAMIAILKAGGATVAIDPAYPESRIKSIIDDTGGNIVIVEPSCSGLFTGLVPSIVEVDLSSIMALPHENDAVSRHYSEPHNPAFVVFTSGSTGRPKGIVIEHRSICTSSRAHSKVMHLGSDSRVLQFAAYTFDVSIQDIFTTLMQGGCVCVPSEAERLNDLAGAINRMNVNWTFLTPTVAKLLSPTDVPTLKTLTLGGEAVTLENLNTWAESVRLLNSFGPAECSVCCAVGLLEGGCEPSNFGYALEGSVLWIVDPTNHDHLTPIGAIGELLIQGPTLARGYLKDPTKTAAAFIENPRWLVTDGKPGQGRFYKTGDLVKYNPDGTMSFVGRKDTQVKLRGQRIELGEIEHAISARTSQGAQVLVDVFKQKDRQILTAFLYLPCNSPKALEPSLVSPELSGSLISTASTKTPPRALDLSDRIRKTLTELKSSLASALPDYMIPSLYIPLTCMPTNTSGKTDRKALRSLAQGLSEEDLAMCSLVDDAESEKISTDMERRLKEIWTKDLNLNSKSIKAGDSFFRLGGDSISAMRLVAIARDASIALTVADVFRNPKLSDMALVATDMRSAPEEESQLDVGPFMLIDGDKRTDELRKALASECDVDYHSILDAYPCTPLQEGLVALTMRQPEAYVSQNVFELPDFIDYNRFQMAWNMVVENTAILRTVIVPTETRGSYQVVLDTTIDWDVAKSLEEYLEEGKKRGIQYGKPLTRFAVVSSKDMKYFVWTAHHSVYDSWTRATILQNVERAYDNIPATSSPPFNRFIQYLINSDKDSSDAYWQSYLGGAMAPEFPPLPPSHQTITNASLEHKACISQRTGTDVTVSTIIRAAWAIILSRYSDSQDVVFGVTQTGRNAPVTQITEIAGPTLTTVPVRVTIDHRQAVSDFLLSVQNEATDMIPFEHAGLHHIKRIVRQPVNNSTQSACDFRTLLVVQPAARQDTTSASLAWTRLMLNAKESHTYPLVVECTLNHDHVQVSAQFDDKLLSKEHVRRIVFQFEHVMHQLNSAANPAIGDISLFSSYDDTKVEAWNTIYPEIVDECVHHMVAQQVGVRSHAVAVSAWDGNFTYQELDQLSDHLAHYLVEFGVGPETLVPLCFDKSIWTTVTMLAILKAGGACVALNPAHPISRLQTIIQSTKATVVVASPQYAHLFTDIAQSIISVDAKLFEQIPQKTGPACLLVCPSNPAFVVFTSGSTGIPKGIILEHRAVCSSARAHGAAMRFSNESRVLQFAAYTFDVAVGETFTTLIHGGTVCVPSEHDRMNDLAGVMRRMNISWAFLTPTVASLIGPSEVPDLEVLSLVGEAVPQEVLNIWASDVFLINAYGPAECTIWSTLFCGQQRSTTPSNIGRGVGALMWITEANNHDALCPVGCPGELLIEGPIIARGYLNEIEKTNAVFIEDPAWARAKTPGMKRRFYKTGDLARYNNDGTIDCLGRKDTQVKLRGQRIELSEIEHHIKFTSPDKTQAVVELLRPVCQGGRQVLAAFICLADGRTQINDDVNCITTDVSYKIQDTMRHVESSLSKLLPSYMIPSLYVPLTFMPTNTSGKTDRKFLRLLGQDMTEDQLARFSWFTGQKRMVESTMEKALQELWIQVLKVGSSTIGADDSFFQLGGDSISAMRLVAAARHSGIALTVVDIFKHSRLSEMAVKASCIQNSTQMEEEIKPFTLLADVKDFERLKADVATEWSIESYRIEDIYPATPLQEGLMALTMKAPTAYINREIFQIPATLDIDRFKAAWEQVIQDTPILRTRIIITDGLGTSQVVLSNELAWNASDNLDAYISEDGQTHFSYGAPLARFAIIEDTATSERYFVWTAHHAIYDGWSYSLILQKVAAAYENSPDTGSKSPPFNSFIKYLKEIDVEASESFWSTQFSGMEAAVYPPLPSATYQAHVTASLEHQMPFSRCMETEITSSIIIRGAWAMIMAQYTDSDDVVFGVTQTGRNAPVPGIESMLGPTFATVPVRVKLDKTETIRGFLANIQDNGIRMVPFEHVGLQQIRRLGGNAKNACNFQNLLVVQQSAHGDQDQSFLSLKKLPTGNEAFNTYALVVECTLGAGVIDIRIQYDAHLISREQIETLSFQFEHIVQQLSQELTSQTVADIETISRRDREQILSWNANYPEVLDNCVHHIFESQATKQPNSLAICSWDGNFTYRELNDLSTNLSEHLQSLGVGPDVIVPFCFEKSAWAIVAMLAILKAGGATAAIDLSYPATRIQSILDSTLATVVLCSPKLCGIFKELVQHVVPINLDFIMSCPSAPAVTTRSLPHNPAFVVFTSGTTGKPKGIIIEHRSFATSHMAHSKVMQLGPTSRVLQYAAYTFDVSIQDIFTTLLRGGCVCVPSDAEKLNDLAGAINRMDVNWTFLTPTVAKLLTPGEVPGLKTLTLGGEAIVRENVSTWVNSVRLLNSYGPAEASVCCAVSELHGIDCEPQNVGHALDGAVLWIAETHNTSRLAPVGIVGELLIQGPTLARGYLNDPTKTALAFIENPPWLPDSGPQTSGQPSQRRLYKTGDLVRYNPDGTMNFVGRKDTQVKLRGQRLELGEIEHHLKLHLPEDVNVVVDIVNLPQQSERQALATFLSFAPEHSLYEASLNASTMSDELQVMMGNLEKLLSDTLPSYMVPSLYIPGAQLTTNASGKLDRKVLRQMVRDMSEQELTVYSLARATKRAPVTVMERQLQLLWSKVLDATPNQIGLDDSFFRLGGDSVCAIKLVALARQSKIHMEVADIFRRPVLSQMALIAEGIEDMVHVDVQPFTLLKDNRVAKYLLGEIATRWNIKSDSIQDIYPCTPLQEGLITLTIQDPTTYVSREVFKLPANIDLQKFQAAWEATYEVIPILRTRVFLSDTLGSFQVVMHEPINWQLGCSLLSYVEQDKQVCIQYGMPLARFAIVGTDPENRYFVWTIHHAVYDGWTRSLIIQNVKCAFYGETLEMSPSFNRFIKYLKDTNSSESDDFWRTQFADLSPTNFPQLPSPDYRPQVDSTLEHSVNISRKENTGITMATIIRAAWALAIGRYSDSSDIVFGVTQAGRNAPVPSISEMAGPTITTVPMRVRVDMAKSIAQFLADVQSNSTDMIPFEHAGLQHIKKLNAECHDACNFHNLLVIQPASENKDDDFLGLLKVETPSKGFLTFALAIECTLGPEKISIAAGYDSAVIEQSQAWRILHQFEHIIQQLSLELDTKTVGEVELLGPSDRKEILEWNRDYPEGIDDCVHHMISRQTKLHPNSTAIDSWDARLSYGELDAVSERLAQHLMTFGIGPEVVVPLCFEKSAWAIVSMLAVIKAGGAFVFLDASHPMARLEEITGQVGAKLVLTSLKNAGIWEGRLATMVVNQETIGALPVNLEPQHAKVSPQNVLYVIFTSGSTGRPKGCVIEHRSMLSGAVHQARESRVGTDTRVLQFASYTFDVSILEMVTSLMHGACICIPSDEDRNKGIAHIINKMKISWVFLTPSVVKLIGPQDVPSLKTLVLGGEALSRLDIETWADHLHLANGYGPSEASVAATCNSHVTRTTDPANIGRAIGGVCWIVDANDHDRLVPIHATGELLVEGPIVARGYLGEPEKTAAVFISNPKWLTDEISGGDRPKRLYKTGDLVRYNSDGTINFVGRKDSQVKVRGQRVELGEIEYYLSIDAYVRHCAVVLPTSGCCKQRLVAVLSLSDVEAANGNAELVPVSETHKDLVSLRITEISDSLSQHVPSYMMPSLWVVVEDIPLLSSGKMNRKKLSTWVENMDEQTYQHISNFGKTRALEIPSNEMEKQIQEVWSTVLHLPLKEVGLRRTFLSLGGDSISAMQVVGRCRLHQIDISPADILRCKTISQLAMNARPSRNSSELPIEEVGVPFGLSPIQKFYADYTLSDDSLSRNTNQRFNFSFCLRLKKETSEVELARAVEAVISQHSMLRARFHKDSSGNWTQSISDDIAGSYRYRVHETADLDLAKPSLEVSRTSLNIEQGPVFAADLVNITGKSVYLFLVAHHLVIDIVSWSTVLRDLEDFLDHGILSMPKPLSFQTWCRLQQEHHSSLMPSSVLPIDIATANLDYWGMRDCVNTLRDTVEQRITINSRVSALLLSTLNAALGTEPIDIIIATLLHSFKTIFKDRTTPTIFNYGHGRASWDPAINVSSTVGWFTTFCPLHIPVKAGDDIVHTLGLTKETRASIPDDGTPYFASRYYAPKCIEAFKNHSTMEMMINYLGAYKQVARSDSRFELHNGFDGGFGAEGQDVKRFSLFNVTVTVEDDCLQFCFAYNTRMQHQDKIRQWIVACEQSITLLSEDLVQINLRKSLAEESSNLVADGRAQRMTLKAVA
ncbi:hypothetical protein BP6252_13184 [Coleophoma cylindrospora]|uniref:Carrier domain-containing protein n=1 Tax=Coleophoma cylindrospora TaxID=1849047 RepID=A0A3D8QAR7_9HELO|nr:hypothetical protein BP6252_13184 [Coleophoma cylindrospora]